MIDQHASAHAVEDALESGEATKDEVIAFLKARIDDKVAHGKRANYPTRHLYEELTGIHAEGATEMKSAAKKAKPDLKIVPKTPAKPSAPAPVKPSAPAKTESEPLSALEQITAALASDDPAAKDAILQAMLENVSPK